MTDNEISGIKRQYANAANLDSRIKLHRLYSTNSQGWSTWVYKQMTFPKGSCVLELGCGNGQLWLDNRDSVPANVTFTLSDFSDGMLKEAKIRMACISGNFKYAVIDAQDIPFENESIDILIANHMLYHVPDLEKALSEIRRVLRIGGIAYCTTMGKRHLAEISEILSKIDKRIVFNEVSHGKFTMQSGPAILSKYLSQVEVREYEDSLKVTNADDLIEYIMSSGGMSNVGTYLQGNKLGILRDILLKEIQAKGYIQISKESGMIIGKKTASQI